jgi:hypothetical protein
MEFGDYAARETSALVGRVMAGVSEKSARDLQALRKALDTVVGAVDAALASQPPAECENEVAQLAGRLAAEAATRAETAGEQVRKQAQATIDQLRAQADATRADCARLEDAHKHAEAARLEIERALEKAREESARLSVQQDEQKAQSEKLAAGLSVATTGLQAAEAQRKDLLAQVKTNAAELDAFRHADEGHQGVCRALQEKLDAAGAELATLRQRTEAAGKEIEHVRAQASVRTTRALEEANTRSEQLLAGKVEAIRQQAVAFLGGSLERLLAVGPTAAGSATIDEVLAAVVDAMAVQFPRVALFRVQGNHLEGVRQVGFDLREDISKILIPRTLDSLVTHAVTSSRIETQAAGERADTSGTPFGGTPDFALALPIVIDGQPLAVVYADDSGQPHQEFAQPEIRLKFAQLLQCQAVPLLARLSAEVKALAELDEYATLLVNELEQTYRAEVKGSAHGSDAERRTQMKEDVEYARRLYAQRAAPEGSRAAELLEQRLLATCDARADTPFGRDLAALVGARRKAGRASGTQRQTGEATGTGAP